MAMPEAANPGAPMAPPTTGDPTTPAVGTKVDAASPGAIGERG